MTFNIQLGTFPEKKEFYAENDFPVDTFANIGKNTETHAILEGEYEGKSYRLLNMEVPDTRLWRLAKGLTALFLTTISLGTALFLPSLRNLWQDAWSGHTIRTIKVLVKATFQLPAAEQKLFSDLKVLLSKPILDDVQVMILIEEIKKIKSTAIKYKQRIAYMDLLNEIRTPIWKKYNSNKQGPNARAEQKILQGLDYIGCKFARKNYVGKLENHFGNPNLPLADRKTQNQFQDYDGKIVPNNAEHPAKSVQTLFSIVDQSEEANVSDVTFRVLNWTNLPGYNAADKSLTFEVEQVPALSQVEAQNFLCGYYALFFLLQSEKDSDLCDRSYFNKLCDNLIEKKILKKITADLRDLEEIPSELSISPNDTPLDALEIPEFANTFPDLKDKKNWFVMDTWNMRVEKELGLTDRSRIYPEERNQQCGDLPIYLIYQTDMHYHFVKVEKTPQSRMKFTIAHSLNYNVSSGTDRWQEADWKGLINYLSLLIAP